MMVFILKITIELIKLIKNIKGDSVWAFLGKVGAGVFQMFISMMLARLLLPVDFGKFQVVYGLIMVGGLLGSFGMPWVIVRLVAEGIARQEAAQSYLAAIKVLTIVALSSCTFAVLFLVFGGSAIQLAFDINVTNLVIYIAILILTVSFMQVIPECFRGMRDIRLASIFSGVATNGLFMLVLFLYYIFFDEASLKVVVVVFFISSLVASIAALLFLFQKLKRIRNINVVGNNSTSGIIKAALPLLGVSILLFVITQADVWLVASLISTEVAAYYAASSRLVFLLTVPAMVANSVIKPIVSDYWVNGRLTALESLLRKTANLTFVISLIPCLILVFYSEEVLHHLYGDYYAKGAGVIKVLATGHMLLLLSGPYSTLLVMTGNQVFLFYSYFLGAIVFLFFSLVLYGFFSEIGIAISVVISTVTIQAFLWVVAKKKCSIKAYVFIGNPFQ